MQFLGLLPGASTLGSRIGGDIGGVLRGLAENKINNMQNAQQTRQKEQFLIQGGLAPNFARALSTQSDDTIQNVLKGLEGFGSAAPAPQQYNQQGQPVMQPQQYNQQPMPMQQQAQNQQQMQQQQTPVDINALVKQAYEQFPELKGQFKPAELSRILQEQVKQQQVSQQPQQQTVLPQVPRIKTKAEAAQEKELQKEEFKLDLKEKAEAKKESIKYLKELNKDVKDTRENNMRLDKMEALIETGRLSPPAFSAALSTLAKGLFGVGIDLKSALTPETQEFDKLSTDFLRGAKNIFGSRVTQGEIDLFLNTIPNIKQSNEAKMAVIDNMRIFNDGKLALEKTAKEIIKENNGIVPVDLETLVEERAAPRLDALAQKFKQIQQRNVAPALGRAYKPGQYQELKSAGKL